MSSQKGEKAPSKEPHSFIRIFLTKLRKRHIIETLAAFIAGGWLFLEFVDRILISHYHINEKWLDVAFFTLLAALLCVILWRWFSGTEKRPGNVKVEVLIVPLIFLAALAIDLNLVFQIAGIPSRKLLIGVIALCVGIAWVFVKLYQWAASTSDATVKKFDISKLAEIKPEKSIVVLPFADLSPGKDQEYFCDGMTEEIITDLSHVHDLLVISRSSAITFKGTKKTIPEIAQAVNVRYVLEGSVRKAGNDLRIAAQLIDATNDAHLWAEKYSGMLDDVFDIQEKVACSIADALRLKLSSKEKKTIAERAINNIKAYEYYLRAKQENAQFAAEPAQRALHCLQNALEIEGDNILIYAGMAESYFVFSHTKVGEEIKNYEKMEEFVRKIFEIDPESSHGYLYLGLIRWKELKPKESLLHFKRAYDINPNDTDSLRWLSFCAAEVGKPSLSEPCVKKLLAINPMDPWTHFSNGWLHIMRGQFQQALKGFEKAYQIAPESSAWGFKYARTLAINHQLEAAYLIFELMAKHFPDDPWALLGSLYQHALQGKKYKAIQLVTEELKNAVRWDETESWYLAGFYALIDEKDSAIDWLENAVWRGFLNYPCLNEYDPFLANIRSEPRFKKLMERVKYEWEHFEV